MLITGHIRGKLQATLAWAELSSPCLEYVMQIVQEEKYKLLAYFFKDSAERDMHGAFKFFITKLVRVTHT